MPRTSTMENTAPSTKEISFARYRVGTDRDAAVPPWSRMAVFMIAIDRTRVAAPQIAPHFASFLLLAVIPRAVKYVLPLRKLRDRYKTELTIQLGDGRSPASAVPYSPAWVMFPKIPDYGNHPHKQGKYDNHRTDGRHNPDQALKPNQICP